MAQTDHRREFQRPLLKKTLNRSISNAGDELVRFRTVLRYLLIEQPDYQLPIFSWLIFILFAILVPILSVLVQCDDCDESHPWPFIILVQISLSSLALVSFKNLSYFSRNYGLRRLLFLDKLCSESERVKHEYVNSVQNAFKKLLWRTGPVIVSFAVYKVWWYFRGSARNFFPWNKYISYLIFCILDSFSFTYRVMLFFFPCVLFHLICQLQILRLDDFTKLFNGEVEADRILIESRKMRRQLKIISHRYRNFVLLSLLIVSLSQLLSLFMTTRSNGSHLNVEKAGDVVICTIILVSGMYVCLNNAVKITHRAQSIVSQATYWHASCTYKASESDVEDADILRSPSRSPEDGQESGHSMSDEEGIDWEELHIGPVAPKAGTAVSFQKRQALVEYLEHNRAGISLYGFNLDRTTLHIIFGINLSLVLWILGKTIGIS